MVLEIEIKEKLITLSLKKKRIIADLISWPEDHSLSRNLLPRIDSLLKKNGIKPKDLRNIRLKSDLDENFTTYRIAKSIAETLNFFLKQKKK